MIERSYSYIVRALVVFCALGSFVALAQAPASTNAAPDTSTQDERLTWWREARFGMFIHWGVYSDLAGEWRGEKVDGYSEHIKRICKISRDDYLNEVVKPFNPTVYDADAWVRTAKEAGMGYIVITAMHHDGVAMYDTAVDDLSVVKMSRFGRDPVRELKDACERHGIKLGFYYSHAVDWSLSGDPRYPEPNGPERRKACVEKKVLPQIRELIRNYHPALIWGDTPHHNPPELNTEILKTIREEDPSIIVNGRLAKGEGDYMTTSDRPAVFRLMDKPGEEDWEAIPTTNESYGYHRYDQSHKPPKHFIQLLARAAARGGNLLMNIGPRGDGTFAPEDEQTLQAIGQWWAVNAESIRGTQRSPLASQSWGESTLKGNRLYLHVFDWPEDGCLVVGGLGGQIRSAALLSDSTRELPFERQGRDVELRLPEFPPDAANSVIVVEFTDSPSGDGLPLLQTNYTNTLSVFSGELLGQSPKLKYWKLSKGMTDTSHVKGWTDVQCGVRWQTRVARPCEFDVIVHYDTPGEINYGGEFIVTVGPETLPGKISELGMDVALNLSRISLKPGFVEIQVSTTTITGVELMRLKGISLQPVGLDKP